MAIGATFVPMLVNEVNDFADAVPGLRRRSHEGRRAARVPRAGLPDRRADSRCDREGRGRRLLGLSSTAVGVAKGVVTAVVAILTIAFLTLFMLLEGPNWVERVYGLVPERHETRVRRIGHEVYRTIGGYVTGNLAISLVAGIVRPRSSCSSWACRSPSRSALIVALLDLVPLAGATIAAVIVTTVAFLDSTTSGIVVLIFFVLYQQFENHVLQPVVYGRTVQLSPLAVLVAVLIGAELAGVVGALGAIPVAGAIQVLLVEWLTHRRAEDAARPPSRTV